MRYLGVDIGGTKIAAGIVDENFHILAEETVPTDVAGGPNAITADIVRAVQAACAQAGTCVDAFPYVGIGCAGTIDAKAGVVKYANNLRFESDVSLAGPVAAALGRPVYLENDANCAGLGEFLALEEHRRIQSFVMITLGTGIGSACVIDGKLYRGFNGAAPELGHCIIEADGILCDCGARGCWEMYCAGHSLRDKAQELARRNPQSAMWAQAGGKLERIDGHAAFAAWREGDAAAGEVVNYYLHYFKVGIANAINAFQPEVLALGGGICNQGDILLEAAREAVHTGSYCKTLQPTTVIRARLGSKAGIFGAAYLRR